MKKLLLIISICSLLIPSCGVYSDIVLPENAHIRIREFDSSSFLGRGSVRVTVFWENISYKDIKYVDFSFKAKNRNGDYVGCTKRKNRKTFVGRDEGPHYSGKASNNIWNDVWYNNSIRDVVIAKIEITFEDGSKVEIEKHEIIFS